MKVLASVLFLLLIQARCDWAPFWPGGSSGQTRGGINAEEPAGSPIPEIGEPVSVRVISQSSVDAKVRIRFLILDYTVRETHLHIPAGVTARPIGPDLASFVGIEGQYVGGGPTPSVARILGQDFQGGDVIEYIIPDPFDEGPELRACCDYATGYCLENTPEDECVTWGTWLEPGMTCADCPMTPVPGACCDMDGVIGLCELLEEGECAEAGGLWLGAGSVCEDCPGPELRACCDYTTGACQENIPEDECLAWGTWLEPGMTCADCPSGDTGPAPPPGKAGNPYPADGAKNVGTSVVLSWTAGSGATSHKVYFGTSDPPSFKTQQSETGYDPGPLEWSTEYYWRIDEVNANGTTTGDLWSFSTASDPCLGADLTGDGDVNESDLAIFEACRTGPGIPYDPEDLPRGCWLEPDDEGFIAADFDRDGDVDQDDFAVLQRCYSGNNGESDIQPYTGSDPDQTGENNIVTPSG